MITTEINEPQVRAALERMLAGVTDMSQVMTDIAEYLAEATKARFATGKAPDGEAWAPKSPATLAAYGARKSNRVDTRPLFGPTGMLNSQIHHDHGSDFASISSNLIQSAVMQWGAAKGAFGTTKTGSSIPWGDIPARPFIGISEADRVEIPAIVEEWLKGLSSP